MNARRIADRMPDPMPNALLGAKHATYATQLTRRFQDPGENPHVSYAAGPVDNRVQRHADRGTARDFAIELSSDRAFEDFLAKVSAAPLRVMLERGMSPLTAELAREYDEETQRLLGEMRSGS